MRAKCGASPLECSWAHILTGHHHGQISDPERSSPSDPCRSKDPWRKYERGGCGKGGGGATLWIPTCARLHSSRTYGNPDPTGILEMAQIRSGSGGTARVSASCMALAWQCLRFVEASLVTCTTTVSCMCGSMQVLPYIDAHVNTKHADSELESVHW